MAKQAESFDDNVTKFEFRKKERTNHRGYYKAELYMKRPSTGVWERISTMKPADLQPSGYISLVSTHHVSEDILNGFISFAKRLRSHSDDGPIYEVRVEQRNTAGYYKAALYMKRPDSDDWEKISSMKPGDLQPKMSDKLKTEYRVPNSILDDYIHTANSLEKPPLN